MLRLAITCRLLASPELFAAASGAALKTAVV